MSLRDRVRQICDDALGRLEVGEGRSLVEQVRDRLVEPLQVTLAGGVSSGKSTLVNALLGQAVAAVDAGECTRVVTWYRYDPHERAEVQLSSGERYTVPLEDGGLPSSLGSPPELIQRLVVHLSNAGLERVTIVDTPGINTVTEANEVNTAEFLGVSVDSPEAQRSVVAISQADALLVLMPHLRQADADVLRGFRSLYEGSALSAVNAVGVLSKIDRLTRDGEPLDIARPIAARVAEDLRGVVAQVVPVIGLLAETASTAAFTEEDARAVAALAAVEDELDREDMLLSPDDLVRFPGVDVPEEERRRLLRLLDLYGIKVAIEAHDAGGRGAAAVLHAIDARSGFAPVREIVLGRFARQADLLKAHAAICDLRRISYLRSDPANDRVLRSLRSPLERLELDPALHRLRVLEVLHAAGAGELVLPADLLADLERLVAGDTPAAQLGADGSPAEGALAGAARWGAFANDPRRSPAEARLARQVKEAFEMLWAQLDGQGAA